MYTYKWPTCLECEESAEYNDTRNTTHRVHWDPITDPERSLHHPVVGAAVLTVELVEAGSDVPKESIRKRRRRRVCKVAPAPAGHGGHPDFLARQAGGQS